MKRQIQFQNGAGIIEILVAVAIIGIVLSALAGFGYLSLKSTEANKKNLSAVNLASESIEAAKAVPEKVTIEEEAEVQEPEADTVE